MGIFTPARGKSSQSQHLFVWGSSILAVALVACFFFPRAPFVGSDLVIYQTSHSVALAGGNPYSPPEMLQAFNSVAGDYKREWSFMWNPPQFLMYPGVLLTFPTNVVYTGWPFVIVVCAALLGTIGAALSGESVVRLHLLALSTFLSYPLLTEIYISQLSCLVALPPILGALLFLRGRSFSAGLLLSFGILKPHTTFLPLCLVAWWIVQTRRWGVIVGTFVGLLASGGAAELVFPGIWQQWIGRSSWPVHVVGSAYPSIIRFYAVRAGYEDPFYLEALFPMLGLVFLAGYVLREVSKPTANALIWALMINPFVTPYGFTFDQITLIVVQVFVVMRLAQIGQVWRGIGCIIAANVLTMFLQTFSFSEVPIWWVTYPIFLFLGFWFLCRQALVGPEIGTKCPELAP